MSEDEEYLGDESEENTETGEGDCPPVSEALCRARRQTIHEEIQGIIRAIRWTGAAITLIVTLVEIALRVL